MTDSSYQRNIVPSGDITGATDTANLNFLITQASKHISLAAGIYFISGTLTLTTSTWLQGSETDATVLQFASGFSGAEMINVTANDCKISDLTIAGVSSTVSSNPVANAIEVTGAQRCRISDVRFLRVNGWCLESVPASANAPLYLQARGLAGNNCDGGIHAKSTSAASFNGQQQYTDVNFQQMGVGTSGLDAFFFEDIQDIQCENFNSSVSDVSTASSMHIKGKCATVHLSNMDLGVFPSGAGTNYVWLIEDSANGSPDDVRVINAVGQQGTYGLRITGGANKLYFTNFRFFNNNSHGASVEGTGSEIIFTACSFSLNGQGASGTNYDLNWSGSSTGLVEGCSFSSPIVAGGNAGIQNVIFFTGTGQAVPFQYNRFTGSGITVSNIFTQKPNIVRGCTGFNPFGPITVAVPATTVAAGALQFDAWFYITAATGGVTVQITGVNGNTGLTIAAGVTMPVFVPASQTITPTYTNAPSWIVYGV